MQHIYFTVTNDLSYDQRMIRICTSLANEGYAVTLVGRQMPGSIPFSKKNFIQKRLPCFFTKGKMFYAEYNLRLFFFLLFKKMDCICAIDLDTILPCFLVSKIKNIKRVYDAHELFCEMKEVVSRPSVYKAWKWIERNTVPHFKHGYTVNELLKKEFFHLYGCHYEVIRSIASNEPLQGLPREKIILYQGAVNEGRCFETLIPAMQWISAPLHICGTGNFYNEVVAMVAKYKLQDKVFLKGLVEPDDLKSTTQKSWVGITLFEKDSLSNYYSLANRFFDYLQAGTPQLCVNYPVYQEINKTHNIAVLIDDLSPENIAEQLNDLLHNEEKWNLLHVNCLVAAKVLNWQEEEKKLIKFYRDILG